MEQIPIRVLNQQTAQVLERVERGESVVITSRGRPVARIVPVTGHELDELVAAGRATPATVTGPVPVPTIEVTDNAVSRALLELRDEERW